MKMNWYFFKGGLNKRTVQAILLICVGTAVASAQVYWFFYFCFFLDDYYAKEKNIKK